MHATVPHIMDSDEGMNVILLTMELNFVILNTGSYMYSLMLTWNIRAKIQPVTASERSQSASSVAQL